MLTRVTDRDIKEGEMVCTREKVQYTPETWLLPEKILELVQGSEECEDSSEYADIIEGVLLHGTGRFKLGKEDSDYYNRRFDLLLHTSRLAMRNNHANMVTLMFLTEKIYSIDLAWIRKQEKCSISTEYQKKYTLVLDAVENAKKI